MTNEAKKADSAAEKLPQGSKFIIAILALMQFTVVLDFMIISPLGDMLMKSLDVTPAQFGKVVSSYAFSAALSGVIAAGFADRFDRKKMLLFFYGGFIIGTLLCGIAPTYNLLLFARIFTGLFGGVIGSINLTIVADLFSLQQRGRVMGYVQMAWAASQVLGIPLGIFIANHLGWHAPFMFIVILSVLVATAIATRLQPINAHLSKRNADHNPFLHLWHTVQNPDYRIGFLAIMFTAIGGFMIMPFGSTYLINNIGISTHQLPFVFMLTGVASMVVMPLVGKLSDKVDKFKIFVGGSILSIIMVITYTNLPVVPLWTVIAVNVILFAGIMVRTVPAQALNTAVPDMKDRGAYMSITSALAQMAGGLGAVIAGYIVVQPGAGKPLQHFDVLGYVVASVIVLCVFLLYRVSQLVKSRVAPAQQVK